MTKGMTERRGGPISCAMHGLNRQDVSHPMTTALPTRRLGTLTVSAIGLGCMGMTSAYGPAAEEGAMVALIRHAHDLGVTHFDTAEAYGPFANERLVGQALAPIRDRVVIATKFGFNIDPDTGARGPGTNSQPAQIRRVAEDALKRLRTDRIDLFYQHRQDPNVPIEDVAGTVRDLIQEGKVRNFGLSEVNVETIRRAHAIQSLTAIQSEYHLMWKKPEEGVLAVCQELGIGFVPYSPMNRGFLTGMLNSQTKFFAENDNRAGLPRFQPDAMAANRPIVEALIDFGHQRGLTPTQVALAWLLHQKSFIVPIPGTTKEAHLMENLAAAEISFSEAEMKELTETIAGMKVFGDRYTPVEQSRVQN